MRIVPVITLDTIIIDSLYHPLFRGALGSYMPLDKAGFAADAANILIVQSKAKLCGQVDVIFQVASDGHAAGDAVNLSAAEAMPLIAVGTVTLAP